MNYIFLFAYNILFTIYKYTTFVNKILLLEN
jgi:hypothetical protein